MTGRSVLMVVALLLGVLSVDAQQLYTREELQKIASQVRDDYKQERYEEALEGCGICVNATKDGTDGFAKEMYQEMVLMLPFCCIHVGCDLMMQQRAEYAKARDVFKKGLSYADRQSESTLLKYMGYAYYFEAAGNKVAERYAAAEKNYKSALGLFRQVADDKDAVSSLKALAALRDYQADVDSALVYLDEAERLADQSGNVLQRVEVLKEQRNLCRKYELWNRCLALTLRVDSIMTHSEQISVRLLGYRDMAEDALEAGRLDRAESLYLQALKMIEEHENDGTKQADIHGVLVKLREIAIQQKQYEKALQYGERCIAVFKEVFDGKKDQSALGYSAMAGIYSKMNDKERCFLYMDSLFKVQTEHTEPVIVGRHYKLRGQMYASFSDWEKALQDYGLADVWMAKSLEKTHPDRFQIKALMAIALYHLDRFDESAALYKEHASVCQQVYGEESENYVRALYYVANIEALAGDVAEGSRDYIRTADKMTCLIKERLRVAPSGKRDAYFEDISGIMLGMAGFGLKSGNRQNEFTKSAYNALLMSKGLLLASDKSTAELIKDSGTEADRALYHQVERLRSEIAALEAARQKDVAKLSSLYRELMGTDARLASQCMAYGDIMKFTDVNYDNVCAALKEDEVLLDLTDFKSDTGKHQYAAFIIRKGQQAPLLIPVCTEEKIDSLLALENQDFSRLYAGESAEAMTDICIRPLMNYIREGEKVYVVPSGIFHKIALDALPMEEGVLVGDQYHFIRLSSAREVCDRSDRRLSAPEAALYGGLVYDMDADEMALESVKYDVSAMFALRGGGVRGDGRFGELPFTKVEVDNIRKSLAEDASVALYAGKRGTEESFLAMDGHSPEIIHLATHGFYYSAEDKNAVQSLSGYSDAMHLTGLVMAGGNAEWTGQTLKKGVLGGLLTADDISRLDLSNTSLVCLSACDTGKGEVTSEGIYGLQRAFKKAGVATIVMSLWEASEVTAALFMTELYQHLSSNGWNVREAFYSARSAVRRMYPEPFYWAGFVMVE